MQFLLIIAHDDAFAPTEELVGQIMSWIKRMTDQGIRVQGRPLRPFRPTWGLVEFRRRAVP